jgi:hypothetical protein
MGIAPWDFWEMTPREVHGWAMSIEEQERRQWAHTAQICALFANCHRGKGKRPFTPQDFYPFKSRGNAAPDMSREEIDALASELSDIGL